MDIFMYISHIAPYVHDFAYYLLMCLPFEKPTNNNILSIMDASKGTFCWIPIYIPILLLVNSLSFLVYLSTFLSENSSAKGLPSVPTSRTKTRDTKLLPFRDRLRAKISTRPQLGTGKYDLSLSP